MENENRTLLEMSALSDVYDEQLKKCTDGKQALMLASSVLDSTIKIFDVLITVEGRQQLFKEISKAGIDE